MSKNSWKYLIDTLLFISLVGTTFTGLIMGLVIPRGPAVTEGSKYFLDLHRHDWGQIHFYLATALVVLTIAHLALNWNWVKCQARQIFKKGWAAALIITVLASILILIIFWSSYPRPSASYIGHGYGAGRNINFQPGLESEDEIIIDGLMTFNQIEKISGIPSSDIIKALGLPAEISREEPLGQLRKIYPFTMQQVRGILIELEKKKTELKKDTSRLEVKNETQTDTRETQPTLLEPEKQKNRAEEEPKLVIGSGAKDKSGILINGQMTLYDLEKVSGLSAREIANELGLPPDIPLDEHLGRLSRRYRFSLQDIRQAVSLLLKQKNQKFEEQK